MRFLILISLTICITCCNNLNPRQKSNAAKDPILSEVKKEYTEQKVETSPKSDPLKVLVVPCSNGYEYSSLGYDFNPVIESELSKQNGMNVSPFPYLKMKGAGFHGVFDKKYCNSIIEKTDADILIMTQFIGDYLSFGSDTPNWGYETRILNTKTMEQRSSIHASKLGSYEKIENHIRKNINVLKQDIEKLK